MVLLLFSYAILPKKLYKPKRFRYNSKLHKQFSLTALSALETYAGYILHLRQKFDQIIILGCHTFGSQNPSDSELMANYLNKQGVSKNIITVCDRGINTVYQVEQAKEILNNKNYPVCAVTLECHKKRTELLLQAYGMFPKMFSVEELFLKNRKRKNPAELSTLLKRFIGSKIEKYLKKETLLLILLQFVDRKGLLQKVLTKIRGIRYFDVDISPRIALI